MSQPLIAANHRRCRPGALVAWLSRALLLAAWVSAAPCAAQSESPGVFGEVIDVRVINLEVVVTDKDGVRVRGLEPQDFELTVDGQEVPIEYFTEVSGGEAVVRGSEVGGTAVPALAPGEEVGTSYLVFIDEFFSLPNDRNRILRRLREQLPLLGDGDRMAVVAYDGGRLEMLSTWSQEVRELERVFEAALQRRSHGLKRLAEQRSFDNTRFEIGPRDRISTVDTDLDLNERYRAELLQGQVERTVMAATAALRSFASPPGRKVMLLLSGGWPYNPAEWVVESPGRAVFSSGVSYGDRLFWPLVDTANRLSYTLYPVDVPGLASSPIDAAERDPFVEGGRRFQQEDRERNAHSTLTILANETGGKALINATGRDAFARVVEDTRSYYWLGFTPQWRGDDSAHTIRIRPRGRGLKMRSRRGFSDLSKKTEVTMMVESSLLFGDPPGATALEASVGESRRSGRRRVRVPLELQIPMEELTFLPQRDSWVSEVELRIGVIDDDGNTSDIPVMPLSFRSEEQPQPGDLGRFETQLEMRKRRHQLLVSVYDKASGKILMQRLEVTP